MSDISERQLPLESSLGKMSINATTNPKRPIKTYGKSKTGAKVDPRCKSTDKSKNKSINSNKNKNKIRSTNLNIQTAKKVRVKRGRFKKRTMGGEGDGVVGPKRKPGLAARFLRDTAEPQVVGRLERWRGGKYVAQVLITLDKVFWVGRNPLCDWVIDNPHISARHLRLYGIRTPGHLSLAVLHDVSSYGFDLNGKPWERSVRIKDDVYESRFVVLRDGDRVCLPEDDTVLIYSHAPTHRHLPLSADERHPHALFDSDDTSLTHSIGPWVAHNYLLGYGQFGAVNLGTHRDSGTQVAIKSMSVARQRRITANVVRKEIELLRKVRHPHVVCMIDHLVDGEEEGGKIHMVLELLAGGDLWTFNHKHAPLLEAETRWFGWQMIQGLKYLHEQGIAHRDIKPENMLLKTTCPYAPLVIGDLGTATTLSRLMGRIPEDTKSKSNSAKYPYVTTRRYQMVGTSKYLSPEHVKWACDSGAAERPDKVYKGTKKEIGGMWLEEDMRCDMWALGVTLFQCAMARHPYDDLQLPGDPDGRDGSSSERELRLLQLERFQEMEMEAFAAIDEEWSEAGIDFLASLLDYNPKTRLSTSAADAHQWLINAQATREIGMLRDKVLVKGQVMRSLSLSF